MLLLLIVALAQSWPEFRGPTAQGHSTETGLPIEWSLTKNVAWKQAVPGHGWSSPILEGGRIYLTSAVPVEGSADLSLAALCFDAATGAELWRREVFRQDGKASPPIHARNSHASPTPVIEAGRIYVHFGHQGTACLDVKGEILWRTESPKFDPEDGNGASPLLVDDVLVIGYDGKDIAFARALEKSTGRELWRVPRKTGAKNSYSYCTPLLITVAGRKQAVLPGSGAVWAYEPKTGREIWRVDYGNGYSVVPRPVLAHGLLYVCTGFEKPRLLAIRPDGEGDVTATHVAWTATQNVPLIASLIVAGDELYMVSDNGVASCLDAKTGKEHWRERLGGQHWTSPTWAEGRIYFQNVDGTGFVVRAATTYELLARNVLGEKTLASPAIGGGALFIRTEKHLYRIQAR